MEQLGKEQAIAFAESGAWKQMTAIERATFQMNQTLLCMPFEVFHQAMEEALKRPVWTHEFGLNHQGLLEELQGKRSAPSTEEIINQLPADKVIIVETK